MRNFSFSDRIQAYCWEPKEPPKAIVQIVHGIAEHARRYDRFANFLTEQGYIVYAHDHLGHGRTASHLGHVEADGFERMLVHMHELTLIAQKNHPNLPIFLFAHSMGSLLAQGYIYQYPHILNGVILSGTKGPALGLTIGSWLAALGKPKREARLIQFLIFGTYNLQFRPYNTPVEWLTRDQIEKNKFIADPHCGFMPTNSFFYSFLTFLKQIHKKKHIKKISKKLPILLCSGDQDPVGQNGASVKKLYYIYHHKLGLQDVTLRLYPEARHEILNEINYQEVQRDILSWLECRCH